MSIAAPTDIAEPIDLSLLELLQEELTGSVDFVQLGISAAIVAIVVVAGHLLAKFIRRKLARFFDGEGDDDVAERYRPLLKSAGTIIRYLAAALLLQIARVSWNWDFFPEILLAFALAFSVAYASYALLRALSLGYWTAGLASLALFAFIISGSVGGVNSLSSMLDKASFTIGDYRLSLLMLVTAVLVVIFLIALIRLGRRIVQILLGRNKALDDGQRLLGDKLALVALVIAAFFIGVDMLGIDLTAFAVFTGAFGLAIGFGLQKTVGNLIAGIILLMDRSIKPGDVIAVGDTYGSVNKIGTRAVSIITRDGKEHLIPNENLMTNEVENWSFSSKNIRVRIPVGVSYDCDMELVQELLHKSLEGNKRLLKRPEPKVLMSGFGDSSVDFEIRGWIRDPEDGVANFQSEIYKSVWTLFKAHDIEIPFPQRDINFRNAIPLPEAKPKAARKKRKAAPSKKG